MYKNFDPRAKIIREVAEEVFQIQGRDPLIDVAVELEKRARADDYFVKRNLYPNVDFYSGQWTELAHALLGVVALSEGETAQWHSFKAIVLFRLAYICEHWNPILTCMDSCIGAVDQLHWCRRSEKDSLSLHSTKIKRLVPQNECLAHNAFCFGCELPGISAPHISGSAIKPDIWILFARRTGVPGNGFPSTVLHSAVCHPARDRLPRALARAAKRPRRQDRAAAAELYGVFVLQPNACFPMRLR